MADVRLRYTPDCHTEITRFGGAAVSRLLGGCCQWRADKLHRERFDWHRAQLHEIAFEARRHKDEEDAGRFAPEFIHVCAVPRGANATVPGPPVVRWSPIWKVNWPERIEKSSSAAWWMCAGGPLPGRRPLR